MLQISTGYDISFNGGITNYVRNISSTLSSFGNEVYVLYSQNNGEVKEYEYNLINYNSILRPFHLSSVISNSDIENIEKIVSELRPDIIHVHMMIDLPVGVLEMFMNYAKVVISLHDYSYVCNRIILLDREGKLCESSNGNLKCNSCISWEETIDSKLGSIIRKSGKILGIDKIKDSSGHKERFEFGKKMFSNVNALIAVSNRVKEIYIRNGFENSNFYVNHIGNYTAEDDFRLSFGKRELKNKDEKFNFGFIGNLNYHKGSDLFFKIASKSHHNFHIYGGIDAHLMELVEQLPNVTYHGKYQHSDLKNILSNVDIGLVLPIWEDNAPQVVFEFLNSGIPILGTRMGGLPDFINDDNGILFSNNDEELVNVINFLNSEEIYSFYNRVVNNIKGTKKSSEHMNDLLSIYQKL
ncbi:glycosyltransferase [Empedobacter sp. UBA5987]|uniref:glycosyltransferase n=1 Tax=Empedobacter sp. UBA5987 TaxID=1946444 RepID=UPI0032E3AA3D